MKPICNTFSCYGSLILLIRYGFYFATRMNYPRYYGTIHCKDIVAGNRQCYLYKNCGYHYTAEKKLDVKPIKVKYMVIKLYISKG